MSSKGTQILTLTGLRFDANLGILDHEKAHPQPIQVDAELNLGTQPLRPSDDDITHVLDSVSYTHLTLPTTPYV